MNDAAFQITSRAEARIRRVQATTVSGKATIPYVFEHPGDVRLPPTLTVHFRDTEDLRTARPELVCRIGELDVLFGEPRMWERVLLGVTLDWDGGAFVFRRNGKILGEEGRRQPTAEEIAAFERSVSLYADPDVPQNENKT